MNKATLCAVGCAMLLTACSPFAAVQPPAPTATAVVASPVAATNRTPTPRPATARPASPTPVATASANDPAFANELATLDAASRPLRDPVALARALGSCRSDPGACPSVVATTPPTRKVGEVVPFYISDSATDTFHEVKAELRYAGPVVLMYVEQGMPYKQGELEQAASTFEQEIYPRTREIFGSEVQPGVDGDLRVTILNARDPSGNVLGYFSSQDSLPRQINRYSNEREMFFMNIALAGFASQDYLDVLAHEFQHMIHQNENPGSALWFNEGSSQLSEDLNGFSNANLCALYLSDPDVQLTQWATAPGESLAHYGAAHLFMRYIYAQYAGEEQIRPLIRANAGEKLGAFVELAARTHPDITSFSQLVGDWAVANLIDTAKVGDGRYSYAPGELPNLLPVRVEPTPMTEHSLAGEVAQYGADYIALPEDSRSVTFHGATTVGLASELPRDRRAWWSNRSDDSVATLTRAFDLSGLSKSTLHFDTWYELEDAYDYAFVSVSTDGGTTWETLPGTLTTKADPQGVNYGNGFTGVSGQPDHKLEDGVRGTWVSETMDLSPYAGKAILLRFWQINDQAFNAPGMLIDQVSIPELNYTDNAETDGGWQANGFIRVDGDLRQRWELRLVRTKADGTLSVEPVPVDATGSATATLATGEHGVLIVIGATPHTSERASYKLRVE